MRRLLFTMLWVWMLVVLVPVVFLGGVLVSMAALMAPAVQWLERVIDRGADG